MRIGCKSHRDGSAHLDSAARPERVKGSSPCPKKASPSQSRYWAPWPAFGQTDLRIGMRDDPGSLDPATNATFVGRVSLQSICDKLVDIDPQGNLIPMLATEWQWSEDGTQVTLSLREGVVFQDGTAFDGVAF